MRPKAKQPSIAGANKVTERSAEPRRRDTDRELIGDSIVVDGWLIALADGVEPVDDPELVLRLADAAAQRHSFIDHDTLERLAAGARTPVESWTDGLASRRRPSSPPATYSIVMNACSPS